MLSPPRFDGLDYTRRRAGRILPAGERLDPPINGWVVILGVVALTLAFCTLTYLFVERPFMVWSHRSGAARRGGFAAAPPASGPTADDRPSEPLAVTD